MGNPEPEIWHELSNEEVLEKLNTNEDGLSDKEAATRLKEEGFNELTQKPPKSILEMLKDQLLDQMVLILIGAAILSAFLNEWIEAIVILAIVVIDATIGIIQEKKATNALEALKKISAPNARILRNDDLSVVPSREIVTGDIVYLEAGDIVPADMRLIEASNLMIQEASLTGEAIAIEKDDLPLVGKNQALGDRINMAYMSTIVTNGNGIGVICAKGMDSEVGKIADSLNEQKDVETPLNKKLDKLGKALALIGLVVCAIVIFSGWLQGAAMVPILMTAISLSISIIPEGLPATATIVMALGVERMAKENAIVKNLAAVETLGAATVICSDKTGTLTQNRMTVTELAVNGDFATGKTSQLKAIKEPTDIQKRLVIASILCNNAQYDTDEAGAFIGDPTEGALLDMGKVLHGDIDTYREDHEKLFEQPFDSDRKLMTTVHEQDGNYYGYTKGALEEILERATLIHDEKGVRELTSKDIEDVKAMSTQMAKRALRVLGFAYQELNEVPDDDDDIEQNLVFVGIVGMIDPPREEVLDAVKTCKQAGIRTVMITGDHHLTAVAIAKSLGIYENGNLALSSDDLEEMSDEELKKVIKDVSVFSRVSPKEKLRIITSLNEVGEVTAMTGDGVNDSPALKAANIGVAMGSGTEVAKDAADVILLDDDFTTIELAIREGRRIYRNIQKVVQFLVAGNIAEILTILIASFIGWQQPILAVHILLINLVTDNIPAIALGVDPVDKNIMKSEPIRTKSLFSDGLGSRIIIHGLFITTATLLTYWYGIVFFDHGIAMTMTFYVLAISQLFHALNQRSNIDSVFVKTERNLWLIYSMIFSAVLLAVLMLVEPVRTFFSLELLTLWQWVFVFALSLLPLVLVEIYKWILRRKRK